MNEESKVDQLALYRHPAVWAFAACWIVAMSYQATLGHWEAVTVWSGRFVGVLLFCWLTIRITDPPAVDKIEERKWRLWLSVALLVVVVFRISYWSPGWTLPGVAEFLDLAGKAAQWIGLPYSYGRNPTAYFVVPLLFLLPLTGIRYLGFRRGHRTWGVIALWCTIPLIAVLVAIVTGSLTVGNYLNSVVRNAMNNGPWEEFLWRGALQTRLVLLLGAPWGIVLTSLCFGVSHFNAQMQYSGGSLIVAIARTIIMQATLGLAFGIIYWRTRNLAACSICHVVFNTVI